MRKHSPCFIAVACTAAAWTAALLLGAEAALAGGRPIEGYGPFRLYQNIPRLQLPRFLPQYALEGEDRQSYEERFVANKMIRSYRCVEELPCASKRSIPALLTLSTVDGKLLHISIETDFSAAPVSTADPAPRPAVSAGEHAGSGPGHTETPAGATAAAEHGDDWEARKQLGNATFLYQINYLFDRYLGHKAGNEDLQQFFDGDGPHYTSTIQSPGSDKEWIAISFYPESPLLQIEVSTRDWDALKLDEQQAVDQVVK